MGRRPPRARTPKYGGSLRLLGLVVVLLTGCAAHLTGVIVHDGGATVLREPYGDTWRLALNEDSRPLRYLDDHLVEVRGTHFGRTVRVSDWNVRDGIHGMAVWVGTLEELGVQIGLFDRNSRAFYLLDDDAARTLAPFVGKPVIVEGYVEGAHRVKVMYFRVLSDP